MHTTKLKEISFRYVTDNIPYGALVSKLSDARIPFCQYDTFDKRGIRKWLYNF